MLGATPVDPHLQDEIRSAEEDMRKADANLRKLEQERLARHAAWEKDNALRVQRELELEQRLNELKEEKNRTARLAGQIHACQTSIRNLERHLDKRREKESAHAHITHHAPRTTHTRLSI